MLCWPPVVAIQVRLRDPARAAARDGVALRRSYRRLFRVWLALGVVALTAALALVGLMVAQ